MGTALDRGFAWRGGSAFAPSAPPLLIMGRATAVGSAHGGSTRLRPRLSERARKRLRVAASRHQRVRFMLYTRIVNPGGQTVVASTIITLPAGNVSHNRRALTAAARVKSQVSCNPLPGGQALATGLALTQAAAARDAITSAVTTVGGDTATQLANIRAVNVNVPTPPPPPDTKPPTLDSGAVAGAPSLAGGLAVFAPPPPAFTPTLASGPLLSGGLSV